MIKYIAKNHIVHIEYKDCQALRIRQYYKPLFTNFIL